MRYDVVPKRFVETDEEKGCTLYSFKRLRTAQTGELINMVNELLGIQYNVVKVDKTDRRVQNLA